MEPRILLLYIFEWTLNAKSNKIANTETNMFLAAALVGSMGGGAQQTPFVHGKVAATNIFL